MRGSTNGGRAQAYQALRHSEELHRTALSTVSDAVFLTDDDGAFTFISPNVDVIFGYVPDEVRAMGHLDRLLGQNPFVPGELEDAGEIRSVEREITTKSGERRVLLVDSKRVSIEGSTVLCACRDITELRRAEAELAAARLDLTHAARLALVGEMTVSVVHELGQPLSAIRANASAGRRLLADAGGSSLSAELDGIFSDIGDVSRDAAEIVGRLRMLARKHALALRPLDLNTVVHDVLQIVAANAHLRGVTVRADLADSLPAIAGDRVSLQQVLLNLILNAMEAMDANSHGHRKLIVVRTRNAGATVECSITDTGQGIPTEVLPRVFDAFFTTKESGVGLGLAVAQSLLQAHRGRLWAEPEEGAATTFRMALPTATTIE